MVNVIVHTDAIIRHQIEKEVAKPAAILETKRIFQQEDKKSKDKWFQGRIDTKEAEKNAKLYGKNLDRIHPETLLPEAKNFMWRRAKLLKDEFVVGMLSREELHPVRGFKEGDRMVWVVDSEKLNALRSVERERAWYKRNEVKIKEFKNIMRHLEPENPDAGNIERFRPKLTGIR